MLAVTGAMAVPLAVALTVAVLVKATAAEALAAVVV